MADPMEVHKDAPPWALEIQDASQSSWPASHLIRQGLPKQEAYVMIDALKNFMSTMIEAFFQ